MADKDIFPDPAEISYYSTGSYDASRAYRDLCSTCNHAKTCEGRSTLQRPIFFCEEFDTVSPVPAEEDDSLRAEPTKPGEIRVASQGTGLCMSCDNAKTCLSPKPAGGVWHCEEYR